MELTEEEIDLVLKNRKEKEEEEKQWTPIKTGELKHDLYQMSWLFDEYSYEDWLTLEQKNDLINTLFRLYGKKGTKFECFLWHGEENWFDTENIGFEQMSDEWANEHLTNIKEV